MGRQRAIERERRWAVPAAVAAVLSFAFYLASYVIERTAGLYSGASDAKQLESLHDNAGAIVFASGVRAIAFLLLPIPLIYLFRAAQARNPQVRAAMIGFVVLGPLLFAVQSVAQGVGARQAASNFVKLAPQEGSRSYPKFQKQLNSDPTAIEKVTIYTANDQLEVQLKDGTFYTVPSYPRQAESGLAGNLDDKNVDNETKDDSESTAGTVQDPGGDALANDTTTNASTLKVAQALLLPAVLGLVVMMIYVPLQAQRVGLLTRFLGSFGMALGASVILILPLALLGVLIWTGYLGLLFVGRVPKGRPPAWEAGEAIPWQRPGEDSADVAGPDDRVVDGDASEIAAGEESTAESSDAPATEKRKRKRRR